MEKDIQALEIARKNLTTTKDFVDQKKIERTELELRIEVCNPFYLALPHLTDRESKL